MTERIPLAPVPADAPIINNLVRMAYNNPQMFRGFGSLSMRVHTESALSDREREIAVLRVVARLGADYEWGNHVEGGRRAGLTDEEIRALRAGRLEAFTARERVLIELAEAVEDRTVSDELWRSASVHFSDKHLHDLTMLVGFYGMASRFVIALAVPMDQGVAGLEQP